VRRLPSFAVLVTLALFPVALAVRLAQHHASLLYPDGYQYLLMARGIGEHLQPTTVLGPGGDAFVPNADAAVKPLFPLAVAAVHALGVSWLDAATLVTVVAGAWVVTVVALLVRALTGSTVAGLAAGTLVLASPSIAFWTGFSGPDPLAVALILSAALAFTHRRARLGGVLTGLAVAARPEMVLLALAAGLLALRDERGRAEVRRAAPAALVTGSLVFALLRTPVAVTDWKLASLLPIGLIALALVMRAPPQVLRYGAVASLGVVAVVVLERPGPSTLWQEDRPLLILAAVALVVLLHDRERSPAALVVLGGVLLLGAVYLVKNPALGRYFALLLPAAALLAGLAVAALPGRFRAAGIAAVAVVAALGLLHPVPGSRDYDMFPVVAGGLESRLETGHEPLVTAAPDAYGFWLPEHGVKRMRPGVRGAVLLDAAQRLYEPQLTADGTVVARVHGALAFARPDLEIDAEPAILVAGRVVASGRG
jgi:hypothetical protein